MTWTRATLPPTHAEWADAMEAELLAMPDDWSALRWAFGCFVAGHGVGLRMLSRRPSALAPLAMSIVALARVLGHYGIYGIVTATDEGTPARVFQLLMVLQGPIIATFAVRGLQFAPIATLEILACHGAAAAAAIVAVVLFT